ncbi:hypothetical protein [Nocardia sp. NBC_01499]|uniref:hypothetical protein n=1 Tax=Nocardia sp. NBC_01499 TaxID=2903597 RepID=UPI00386B1BC1
MIERQREFMNPCQPRSRHDHRQPTIPRGTARSRRCRPDRTVRRLAAACGEHPFRRAVP